MTPKHDYDAAIDFAKTKYAIYSQVPENARHWGGILYALRIAKALQDGPSSDMRAVIINQRTRGRNKSTGPVAFALNMHNAIRDQIYREVEGK